MKKTIGLIPANYPGGQFQHLIDERAVASIPFGGRYRLVDFALSNMTNAGIITIGFIMPYRYRSIIDHVGVGRAWSLARKTGGLFVLPGSVYGVNVGDTKILVRDLERNLQFLLRDDAEHVLFCNCNVVMNVDFKALIKAHEESGNQITFAYASRSRLETSDYYLSLNDDGSVRKITKEKDDELMRYADCFIIERKHLLELINGFKNVAYMDLIDIMMQYKDRIEIGSYELKGYVSIVNDLDGYALASRDLLNRDINKELFNIDRPIRTKVADEPPAIYGNDANVRNSIISTGCIIEGTVINSILFRSVHVRPGAVVKDSIILQHGDIKSDAMLEGIITDKYATISEGTQIRSGEGKYFTVGKYITL